MIEFGTGGFRSIIGEDFNKENVQIVSNALATYIKNTKSKMRVVIGYDYRFCSEYACKWVASTLAANNIEVLLSDSPVSTPITMNMVEQLDLDYGVMITASHNQYMYNGVKIFAKHGKDISIETSDELVKIIDTTNKIPYGNFNDLLKENKIKYIDFKNVYFSTIKKLLNRSEEANNLHVLIDPIYGTGSIAMPIICDYLGVKWTMRNDTHDAYFGGMAPNPLESNMIEDKKLLIKNKYDVCFGFDSDADRLAVLDEKGNYIDANVLFGLSYYYLGHYQNVKGDAVRNIQTSHLIDAIADKFGCKCYETDVGANNVSDKMKEIDGNLGGESSGGIIQKGFIDGKDACFQAGLLLEMMINIKKPLSYIIEEMFEFSGFNMSHKEIAITYNKDARRSIFKQTHEQSPDFKDKVCEKKILNNNIKYSFEDGTWALLRFSGTEPKIRVFVEGPSKESVQRKVSIIKQFVDSKNS